MNEPCQMLRCVKLTYLGQLRYKTNFDVPIECAFETVLEYNHFRHRYLIKPDSFISRVNAFLVLLKIWYYYNCYSATRRPLWQTLRSCFAVVWPKKTS
jgi:hypothetical protein